jgi:hypothetical protein
VPKIPQPRPTDLIELNIIIIRPRIAMDIRIHLAKRLTGISSMLAVIMMAMAVTIGTGQAQSAATTSSHASLSGIQSVITQARDSLQRRMRAAQQRFQRKQPAATNPDASPIAK